MTLRPVSLVLALSMTAVHGWSQVRVGPEFHVNTFTTGLQGTPSVASAGDGRFVIAWTSVGPDGSGGGIFAQRYNPSGTPVGVEFQVNTYTTSEQRGPRVASDPNGNFVVVWVSVGQDGSDRGIYARRYDTTSGPGPEFRVNTHTTARQNSPAVAMDPAGNFVVTWHSLGVDGSSYSVQAQRYDALGNPQGGEFQVNSYTTGGQGYPAVALDPGGNFVIAWNGNDFVNGYQVGAQRFNAAGTPLGGELQVTMPGGGAQNGYPAVAMNADSRFVVVWMRQYIGGTFVDVFAQRYDPTGAPQGAVFQVNSYTTGYQTHPTMALDGAGNFVVTWRSYDHQDGDYAGIFGRRFDPAGNSTGEFQVNTYTTGWQEWSSVSMDAAGNFVIAWQSEDGEEGDGETGIIAQRFRPDAIFRDGFE
jgi:hypothetical protein